MKYRLTTAASRDFYAIILRSLRTFGPVQARQYSATIDAELAQIAQYPRAARERQIRRIRARVRSVGVHAIVYRLVKDEVVVLRILHGRQDAKRHLG